MTEAELLKFLLTPLREGRRKEPKKPRPDLAISTHAPAGGATSSGCWKKSKRQNFYSRPCGRGDLRRRARQTDRGNFYSRPCGRGDPAAAAAMAAGNSISTHAPAGGATGQWWPCRFCRLSYFYSRPCGRGDRDRNAERRCAGNNFYSRPCGRGDNLGFEPRDQKCRISTHAPAGGATRLARNGRF